MKRITTQIYLCLILILGFYTNVFAQEKKDALIVNGTLEHLIRTGRTFEDLGFYKNPVAPGISVLYQHQITPKYFLSSGVVYQMGRLATYDGYVDRFRFGEMSVPLVLKRVLSENEHSEFSMSAGAFYGKMIHLDWESPSSGDWIDVPRRYDEHYSEKNSFADLFFSLGISFPNNTGNKIGIEPYLKYRLKENWMGYARQDLYYGLMLNYKLSCWNK